MRQKVPESGVLRACIGLLAAERIWHRRWNSGAMIDSTGRPVRFGVKGDADILASFRCVRLNGPPEFLWIECKSDKGKQSPEQVEFQKEVTAAGHNYLIVRDAYQLRDWLIDHGAIR